MEFFTADLCDELGDKVQVLEPILKSFGAKQKFNGKIETILLDEDNSDLITLLKEDGTGKVVVVDVSGVYVAVVGENLMKLAFKNNWNGIVVNGYVRDITYTNKIDVGLMAIGTCPKKSQKKAIGVRDKTVSFGKVKFIPNHTIYVDSDGIITIDEL